MGNEGELNRDKSRSLQLICKVRNNLISNLKEMTANDCALLVGEICDYVSDSLDLIKHNETSKRVFDDSIHITIHKFSYDDIYQVRILAVTRTTTFSIIRFLRNIRKLIKFERSKPTITPADLDTVDSCQQWLTRIWAVKKEVQLRSLYWDYFSIYNNNGELSVNINYSTGATGEENVRCYQERTQIVLSILSLRSDSLSKNLLTINNCLQFYFNKDVVKVILDYLYT